jgi:hypothetical protein
MGVDRHSRQRRNECNEFEKRVNDERERNGARYYTSRHIEKLQDLFYATLHLIGRLHFGRVIRFGSCRFIVAYHAHAPLVLGRSC